MCGKQLRLVGYTAEYLSLNRICGYLQFWRGRIKIVMIGA